MLQPNSNLSAAGSAYSHIGKPNITVGGYIKTTTVINDKADAYNKRGIVHCENGDYEQGIAQFNKAIALVPEFTDAYYNRGITYARKGDFDNAIKNFNIVIKRQPDNAKAYNDRGFVHRLKHDFEKLSQILTRR